MAFAPPLGAVLPDVRLADSSGAEVALPALLAARPAVVVPVYYACPMLCAAVLDGLEHTLRALDLRPGDDFELVVYSIDPTETPERAARARRQFLDRARHADAARGVHFLTGTAPELARLGDALGFRAVRNDATGQYAHAAGLVVTAPGGRLSRFLAGIDHRARDLRLALVEAADGAVGDLVDAALLYCFQYDPATGRYSTAVFRLVRTGGVLTVAALAAFVLWARRRERMLRDDDDVVGRVAPRSPTRRSGDV